FVGKRAWVLLRRDSSHSSKRPVESMLCMRVREALKKSMSFIGGIVSSRLRSMPLARHDSRGFSVGAGQTGQEAGPTLRRGTIESWAWGLRSLLLWLIGLSRTRILKRISRGG